VNFCSDDCSFEASALCGCLIAIFSLHCLRPKFAATFANMSSNPRPWYHKNLSRMKAEELLNKANEPGSFLVRESESLRNTRVLSVLTNLGISHYRIEKDKDGRYCLAAEEKAIPQYFESMEHLLSFYETKRDQMPIPLKVAIQCERISLDSEMEDLDEDENEIANDQDNDSYVSTFFLQQLQILKGKSKDADFEKLVESYIKNKLLIHDLYKAENGIKKLPNLHKLVQSATADLQKAVDAFSKKLSFLQDLFDVGENIPQKKKDDKMKDHISTSKTMEHPYATDVEGLLHQVENCKSIISELQEKSYRVMKDYSGRPKSQAISSREETYEVIPQMQNRKRSAQGICQVFLAYKSNKKARVYISVNMKKGTVAFLKSPDEYQSPSNSVSHKAITQLLKDEASKTSLGITINRKIATYHFEDFKSRELFCLMIEKMKSIHSDHKSKGHLTQVSIFAGTWNMGSAQFPEDISSWLKCSGMGKDKAFDVDNPYDIVAIGIQESGASEKELITKIKDVLKKLFSTDYSLVAKGNLWDIRLIIFIKPMHMSQVSEVKQSIVKLGIANTLGNKGAVGISFYFGSTSFCFINSHLQARVERLAKRNQNFHDTLRNLNLGQQGVFDVSNHFHHLFWFGDLNYRVDGLEIEDVLKKIIGNDLDSLLEYDQLSREKRNGNAFFGFEEEKITFRPTYRYKVGSHNMYIWLKKKPGTNITNVPSWPDRVLWKSFPQVYIANTSYGSTEDIMTSDHAPVFSTFDVGLLAQSQGLGCDELKPEQNKASIEFLHVEAKLRTSCKTKFILLFESTCLEAPKESLTNSISDWRSGRRQITNVFSFPAWKADDLLKLSPALSNQRYLQDQHIKIAVKAEDGHESYGECVLALRRLVTGKTEEVTCCLTHLGDESGEITLMLRVKTDTNEGIDPVITNVNDLQSIKSAEDEVERRDSGVSSVDTECIPKNSKAQPAHHSSLPRNYELVGDFAMPDVPPVPPKKRLSKQLSQPPLDGRQQDSTSAIIWIGEPNPDPTHCEDHQFPMEVRSRPPLPLPTRRASDCPPTEIEDRPVPKPRSKNSLARSTPKTIKEWLRRINLCQYEENLLNAGWDDVGFLDFTNVDLFEAGIADAGHRQILLTTAEITKRKNLQSSKY